MAPPQIVDEPAIQMIASTLREAVAVAIATTRN